MDENWAECCRLTALPKPSAGAAGTMAGLGAAWVCSGARGLLLLARSGRASFSLPSPGLNVAASGEGMRFLSE